MNKKRFAVEQIIAVLKEVEAGMAVGGTDLYRHTAQTLYRSKK